MERSFSRCAVIVCLLIAVLHFRALAGEDAPSGPGKKQSYVTGKLVDSKDKPLAGVKIVAMQKQPFQSRDQSEVAFQGYDQIETVTGDDGAFKLSGLFPLSVYAIKPRSDKWGESDVGLLEGTGLKSVEITAAPAGETLIIKETIKVRFFRSSDGIITDNKTNLQWLRGPDQPMQYKQAEQWVTAQTVAGGGWSMPTLAELKTLYDELTHLPPIFLPNYNVMFYALPAPRLVWAEASLDSSSVGVFDFENGRKSLMKRDDYSSKIVFAVRPLSSATPAATACSGTACSEEPSKDPAKLARQADEGNVKAQVHLDSVVNRLTNL